MSSPNDLLGAYLSDHVAGARAALDLIEKLRSHNEGTPLAAHLAELAGEIEADREVVAQLLERIGEAKNLVKQVAGGVAERLSRARLDRRVTGSAELSRLLELEMLALGIEGKLALWHALRPVAVTNPDVAALDLDDLVARAQAQRQGVEVHRLEAAARAFGG
jgi:hypothetical protein